MDFELPADLKKIQEETRQFVDRRYAPGPGHREKEEESRRDRAPHG